MWVPTVDHIHTTPDGLSRSHDVEVVKQLFLDEFCEYENLDRKVRNYRPLVRSASESRQKIELIKLMLRAKWN